MISTSYRVLLQQAYAHGNTSPDNDIFAKPKHHIKKTRRRKVSRDKDGNLIIKSYVTVSAVPTRSTKCNTTEQAARAAVYGRVLGAAEGQSSAYRDVMRYIYSPLCPSTSAVYAFWEIILAVNQYTIGLTPSQQYRVCCVVPAIMRDQFQEYRGGKRIYSDADICRIMGIRQANYAEHWERHIVMIRSIIDRVEYRASFRVREFVKQIHDCVLTEGIN